MLYKCTPSPDSSPDPLLLCQIPSVRALMSALESRAPQLLMRRLHVHSSPEDTAAGGLQIHSLPQPLAAGKVEAALTPSRGAVAAACTPSRGSPLPSTTKGEQQPLHHLKELMYVVQLQLQVCGDPWSHQGGKHVSATAGAA